MFPNTRKYIQKMIDDKTIPGANYLIYQKGHYIKEHVGYKQVFPTKEVSRSDTLYDMASLTKVMMTNTVVLKLIEQDKLDIDEPFHTYLPVWHEDSVTLRHLLTHTSAISGYIDKRDELTANELKQALLTLPVDYSKIGIEKTYTDTGTLLIGFMLEEMYQQSVHDIFIHEVIMPLNMNHSGFYNVETSLCAPTEVTKNRGLIKGSVHDPKAFQLKEHCGSAGLFSTIDDSFKFVNMMLHKGKLPSGKSFLEEKTVKELLNDYTPTKELSRSLGWDLKYHYQTKNPILFHTGYTGTFILIDIFEQEAFIFLSNRVHPVDNRLDYIRKRDELIDVFQKEQTN